MRHVKVRDVFDIVEIMLKLPKIHMMTHLMYLNCIELEMMAMAKWILHREWKLKAYIVKRITILMVMKWKENTMRIPNQI